MKIEDAFKEDYNWGKIREKVNKRFIERSIVEKAIESMMHGDDQSEDDGDRVLKELGFRK